MNHTVAVSKTLIRRLWIALAAGAGSFAITLGQGLIRPGYDAWQQAVSALSLGPGGWIQMLNLVAFGLAMLTTVAPWRRILAGGRGATAYPLLTMFTGMGFIVVGVIRQDPAPGYDPAGLALTAPTPFGIAHLAIAGVAALSSVVGLFIMAARFAGDAAWPRWSLYSSASAIGMILCIAVYAVWSVQPTGFAGTFERAAMIIPMVWMFAFLQRLDRGAPFMIANRSTHVPAIPSLE